MIIWKSTYRDLLNKLEHYEKSICDQHKTIVRVEKERDEARNLKAILDALYPLTAVFSYAYKSDGRIGVNLPDDVVRRVPDFFGGPDVLSHEATRVVVLNQKGEVSKVAFTKKKPDTGYSYLLVREKPVIAKK